MRFVIQRVSEACVTIDGSLHSSIKQGFLVLIGIEASDTTDIADKLISKLIGLRIFEDEDGKTNLSLDKVDGSLLLVSQFTLLADCKKGNRPSFIRAGAPDMSEKLYDYIVDRCKASYAGTVESGIFGADMKVSLINDGPFTIIFDSKEMI